jgi:hypothetical protein
MITAPAPSSPEPTGYQTGAPIQWPRRERLASDKVDYKPAFQPTQNETIVNRTESVQAVVAGVAAPMSVWNESRYDNFGR